MKRIVSFIVATLFVATVFAQGNQKFLCGNIIASDGSMPIGIYAMTLDDGDVEMTRIVANPEIKADNGGTIVDGEVHFINRNDNRQYVYHRFSMDSWQRVAQPELLNADFKVGDFTYDAATGRLWAYFDEEWANGVHTYSRFGYADAATKAVTILHEGDQNKREMMGICMSKKGRVFAMDPLARVWEVDKTTGEATQISKLGMRYWMGAGHYSDTKFSMVYDDDDNCFYATVIPEEEPRSLLVRLDVYTGTVTELAELGREIEFGMLWLTNEMPDGIENIYQNTTDRNAIYTLNGHKVMGNDVPKGIYIQNGKKVIKQ